MQKQIKRSEFYRSFSLGLVYPAVLGTLIFQILEISNKSSTEGLISFKLVVLSFLVVIYTLDFLKNSLDNYSLSKVVFDLITVLGLYFSYSSLNLNEGEDSPVKLIQLSFSYFILTGLENNWIFTKEIFLNKNSRTDEFLKEIFNINRNANTISFILGGGFMFVGLGLAKNKDYNLWLVWFVIFSTLLIISELVRLFKLARQCTIKD